VVQASEDAEVYLGDFSGDLTVDGILPGSQHGERQVLAGPILGMAPYEVMGHTSRDELWQLLELWAGGSEGPQLYSLAAEAWYADEGDFDGNGSADLVLVGDATLYYVRSQAEAGQPSFACYIPYFYGGNVDHMIMGDFDGNGRADVAVSTSGDISILLTQSP
jgi:hypothetical protein